MQKRSEQTRQALIRASAELIASGRAGDAGLVNVCRSAGVTRGALYHHFSSMGELAAAVYEQAHTRVTALADEAFDGEATETAVARFSGALNSALRDDPMVRAGLRLAPDGSAEAPRLREEVLDLVHRRLPDLALADLAVVVMAGLESLGRTDATWWEPDRTGRIWERLRPHFTGA